MTRSQHRSQRGLAALSTTLLLLLTMTIAALCTQQALVFEQRSSAHQLRAAQAFEAAEAGLAWGIEKLNDARTAGVPACDTAPASNLRDRPLPWTLTCTSASCRCGSPERSGLDAPGWVLRASADAAGRIALESRGCTRLSACDPLAPGFAHEAAAAHRLTLAPLPLLRLEPAAALVAAGPIRVGDGVTVTSRDASGHGATAMTGATLSLAPAARLEGWPGTPPSATAHEHEPLLEAWTRGADAGLFRGFFGLAPAEFRADRLTRVLARSECSGAAACGAALARAAAAGYRQFWVESALQFDAAPQGDPALVIVAESDVTLARGVDLQALVIGLGPQTRLHGDGAALRGAIVAAGGLQVAGTALQIDHQPIAPQGRYVAVPGSWRDFAPTEP